MRLLYITNGITGVGGLERVLSIKASYMAEHLGYEVDFLTLNESGKKPFYEFNPKINFHSIEVKGNPLLYIRSYLTGIQKHITSINPDRIIVCDDGLKAFFLPLIFRKQKFLYERHVSNKIMFQNSSSFVKKISAKFQLFLMNRLSKRFEYFIVLNEGNKKEWKYQDNIKVIGNPISFFPDHQAELISHKAIAVGKQSFQKNYERMISLWAKAIKNFPDWELHIYGKKDDSLQLEKQLQKLNLEKNVFLHEPVQNIRDKYLESSLFLMTSRFEGMPMVMLEAMACGLPLISFDSPHGPRELIHDGFNGFLIDYDDDQNYIKRLIELIENTELRKNIGTNARRKSGGYSIDSVMSEWLKLLNK